MHFRTTEPHELEAALDTAGEPVTEKYTRMREQYPDLFLCACDGEKIVGICCGYPTCEDGPTEEMRLDVIAFLREYWLKGYGTQLLALWEERVGARGDWTIGLGSGADGFYLKRGYTACEYAVRVPKAKLPGNFRELGFEITEVRDPSALGSDEVTLKSPVGARYQPEVFAEMQQVFGATSSFTVFRKRVGHPPVARMP
jgi:GNAT superfamily N-acetyltransferase